jgi:hypothetical protein
MRSVVPAIVQMIVVLVLPVVAGIWYATRRRAPLTLPGCRHCGAPRSFRSVVQQEACSGCNRSGEGLGAPIPLGRRSWRAAIWPPAILMALGVAAAIGTNFLRPTPLGGFGSRPTLTTLYADLVLNRRIMSGELEDLLLREQEGEDIVGGSRAALVALIGEGPIDADAARQIPSIATPSGSGPMDLAAIALLGLPGSNEPPPELDPDLAARVLHACFLPYRLDADAFRQNRLIRIDSGGFEPVQSPLKRVFRVIACRVDGEPVELIDPHVPASATGAAAPLLLASDHLLLLAQPAPASTSPATSDNPRRVEIDCDEFLYRRFDAERLRDLSGRVIPLERWPTPLATRRVTLTLDRVP